MIYNYCMDLSQVSLTAIATLTSRAVETGRKNSTFSDPMACLCLERLIATAAPADQRWILRMKRLYSGSQAIHTRVLARRVGTFDRLADQFIASHPGCTVVNLGCGLDTRFWRIQSQNCRFVEIDLPEMVALKRALLREHIRYELIGGSVLDPGWIEQVTRGGSNDFLFVAEGLFMYLPRPGAIGLFQLLAGCFDHSQLLLDTVPETYTRGLLKSLIAFETRVTWGLETSYVFGIDHPRQIEGFAPGLKVSGVVKGFMNVGPIITVSINP